MSGVFTPAFAQVVRVELGGAAAHTGLVGGVFSADRIGASPALNGGVSLMQGALAPTLSAPSIHTSINPAAEVSAALKLSAIPAAAKTGKPAAPAVAEAAFSALGSARALTGELSAASISGRDEAAALSAAFDGLKAIPEALSVSIPNRPWRKVGPNLSDAENSHLKGTHGEELHVVEFDDQGELFGNAQRDSALDHIGKLVQTSEKVMLLVFVHGWHHNAKDGDKNLESFRQTLAQLADAPTHKKYKWVGVYVGWRGESLKPPLNKFTFWNRRLAAARTGGIPAAHLLEELSSVVQKKEGNKLIVIGHSFGGRIVETAVTNALSNSDKLRPDLVVLLNEASDALRAKMAIDVFKRNAEKNPLADAPGPQIISITSSGDWDTKLLFPIGQSLAAIGKTFRNYKESGRNEAERNLPSQRNLFLHTAGHTKALLSHEVRAIDQVQASHLADATPFSTDSLLPLQPNYALVPLNGVYNEKTPYWIVRVAKEIILDHQDIFNAQVRGMLAGIIVKWFTR